MNLRRLPAVLILLGAIAATACGNKADLFMPPPPDDEAPVNDPVRDGALERGVSGDEVATPAASGLPLPVPTGDGPDQPFAPPADDADADAGPPPSDDGDAEPPPDPPAGG